MIIHLNIKGFAYSTKYFTREKELVCHRYYEKIISIKFLEIKDKKNWDNVL